jgi:hypothetical protein
MDEREKKFEHDVRTLFADERVIPVVGIVRVAKSSMRILKFEKLVPMLARMTRTLLYNGRAQGARRDAGSVSSLELAMTEREYAY